jgi:glycosyltransferase involved in cell wall biosynthesis
MNDLTNKTVVNLIQDLPTPHNNFLIEQFIDHPDIELRLWYANSFDLSRYQWRSNLSDEHISSKIYGSNLNLRFLWHCVTKINEKFILVGWMNHNTAILHFIFFILRRKFNHWTDLPNPEIKGRTVLKNLARWLAYRMLKWCRCRVLGVGQPALNYFRKIGFPDAMLVNFPIFISVDNDFSIYKRDEALHHLKYNVPPNGVLISAGSRLIREKGYDLLIDAIRALPKDLLDRVRLVIVGSGEELTALNNQILSLNLEGIVHLDGWMEFDDFKSVIANSNIFVQPARFDSYGGTILAMSLGVAVIGSISSGAAYDRIVHGENGLLYEANDTAALAAHISRLVTNPAERSKIAACGRNTALQWPLSLGVNIIKSRII